ncbi:unnamed protein product, partial [Meganyctiphanes norvegica]
MTKETELTTASPVLTVTVLSQVAWIKADSKAILAIHNRVITHNNRMNVIHSDHKTWELKIKDVRRNDTGQYMCQVNTDPMKMQVGYLNVVIPPDIINDDTSGDVMVPEGSSVMLQCRARGFPEPRVEWRREDGKPLVLGEPGMPKNEVYTWEGEELVMTKIARDDMGAYLCIASNDIPPAVSKRMVVQVHFHPLIRIPNQLVSAPVGTNITLECHVEASPKSINFWTKDVPDQVSTKDYVKLVKICMYKRLSEFDKYQCISRNSCSEVNFYIHDAEDHLSIKPPTEMQGVLFQRSASPAAAAPAPQPTPAPASVKHRLPHASSSSSVGSYRPSSRRVQQRSQMSPAAAPPPAAAAPAPQPAPAPASVQLRAPPAILSSSSSSS